MGCAASKSEEETSTKEVKVSKQSTDDDDTDTPREDEAKKPASLAAPTIQVRGNKAAEKLAEKRREEKAAEEAAKTKKRPLGSVAKTNVKAAVRMTKASEMKKDALSPPSAKPPKSPAAGAKKGGGFTSVVPAGNTNNNQESNPLLPPGIVSSPSTANNVDTNANSTISTGSSGTFLAKEPSYTFSDSDFEGFQTMKLLGKGAFGSTYECGLKSMKIVCVKVIEFGDIADGSQEMTNLRNEISLMRRFNHPNIVQYYGCTEDKNKKVINIFMEYVTGGTLNSYMAKFKDGVSHDTARDWTRQMCEGVNYLHEQGVVHRDIKGANVLMTMNGEVKLADFGCSKSIDDSVSKTRGCQTMVGTPYWMAPEVLKCESYGTKSDVWSIACTVVEMLTGKPAWPESENMWSAVYKIAQSKGLPPNIPKNLPKKMMNFLERAFERDPAKRASCRELLKHPWLTEK